MPVYRYLQASIDLSCLEDLVPGPLTLGETGPDIFVDISADVAAKDDLDAAMKAWGWSFSSQDPLTTPKEEAAIESRLPSITLDVSAGGPFVLGPEQYARKFLILVGALLADVALELPAINGQEWVVVNRAIMGSNLITMHVTGSTLTIIMPEGTQHVWTDGTDLLPVAAQVP